MQMQRKNKRDWHRSYVIAALNERGWSLRKLSREVGLGQDTLRNALYRDYPKGERIIAAAIGVPPEQIWAERYAKRREPSITPAIALAMAG